MRSILSLLLLGTAFAKFAADKVDSLPGMGNFTTFGLYSGYINVNGTAKSLHYVLAESQTDPINNPLIIWFNGGPGCSSMLGFL